MQALLCCCLFYAPLPILSWFISIRGTLGSSSSLGVYPLPSHPRSWLIPDLSIVFAPVSRCEGTLGLVACFTTSISFCSRCLRGLPVFRPRLFDRGRHSDGVSTVSASSPPTVHYITRTFVARPFMDHADHLSCVRMAVGSSPAHWLRLDIVRWRCG